MLRSCTLAAVLAFVMHSAAFAQKNRPIPYPVIPPPQFEAALEAGTRSTNGAPGPAYWTNTANYQIKTVVSPGSNTLRGQETITYNNNSPDTLAVLLVHLRQNLHKEGAARNRQQKLTGGMEVANVEIDGQPLVERGSSREVGFSIRGTVMGIRPPQPLLPGGSATMTIGWSFDIPERGAPRMGQDGEVYYLAYWYPQMAVYDDVNGWRADPYMGDGEFYMGYGNYDVAITVPEGYLVAATGVLQNPTDVLTEGVRDRLEQATKTDDVVRVVTEEQRGAGTATTTNPAAMLTWRFRAENVRDFAFGTSNLYLWDATRADVGDLDGDGTDDYSAIYAYYRPGSNWERSAEFADFSIEHLSAMLFPYPYPHMSTVEGIIGGGMEYPMITLIGSGRSPESIFGVTYHELGHMWFPMVVGQDEKSYTWMDEGLTSFNTNEGSAEFWKRDTWDPRNQGYYFIANSGQEVESMRHADQYPSNTAARGIASYSKPAVSLHALRGIVGEDRFWPAYQEYARRWKFKHPQPYDLFNSFEDVLGEDMDWFWTTMFFETWTMDHAIAGVEETSTGIVVTIEDKGLSPMPSPVRITYQDGTVEDRTVPVSVWLDDNLKASLEFPPGAVASVEIDPDKFLPDVDRENNTWAPPAVRSEGSGG